MIVNLGGPGLLRTIGAATVQIDNKCRCIGFVRAPAQLGTLSAGSTADDAKSPCTTGEVTFTAVRAPCAQRSSAAAALMQEGGGDSQQQQQFSSLSSPSSGVVNSEPIVAMVQRAVERSVIFEQLPLARFELVVHILSSTDEESDLQGVAAAACGALIDSNIPLRGVFGAWSVPIRGGDSSAESAADGGGGYVRAVVSAHTGGVLGMQSTASSCSPEELCRAAESCVKKAAGETLTAFGAAAARAGSASKAHQ